MKKRLLNKLRGSGTYALAVAALLLTSTAGLAQTTAYCATGLGGGCGGNDVTAVTIAGSTLNATGLTCPGTATDAYTAYPATGGTTATLASGAAYTLATTLSGASIVSVWIDYNHNFVFEASEWTQIATSSAVNTPVSVQIIVPATAVQGQTAMRIRSRATGSANGAADACTQFFSGETKDFTVTIGAPTACPLVTGVSVTNITATGARVNFTPTTSASNYTVTLTPPTGAPTTQTVTASPVNLTGLTASSSYTVSIVSSCGAGQTSSAYVVPFATACVAAPYTTVNNTTPYTQDFEATWLSQCGTKDVPATSWRNTPITGDNSWRRDDDGASAGWVAPTSGSYTPAGSPLGSTGLHSARFHSYNAPSHSAGLLDLYLNMAGTSGTPTLNFDHINTTGTDSLKVYVSTDGGGTFGAAPVAGFATATAWTRRTVALPTGLTATTIVRLRASSDFGFTDIGLDNVRVGYVSCPPVTGASVTGITATGASLSFTPGAGSTSYTVTVTPAGGTATTLTPAPTGSPVALTGLTASTTYTVSIAGNCGGTNGSSSATSLTFSTACVAAPYTTVNNTTPYTQDFEATWLSQCDTRDVPGVNWRNTPTTGNNSWRRDDDGASAAWGSVTSGVYTPAGSPLGGGTSLHSARFHTYSAASRTTGQLDLSVNMAGTVGTPTLSFDYINTSGADSLKVYVSTNGGSTFGAALLALRNASTWTAQTVALPTGLTATTIVRLRASSDFGLTDIGLDNVRVSYVSCPAVTGVSVSNITTTGATLDFTASPGGASYLVTVMPAGGTAITQTVTASPVTLTGLTPSTAYTISIVTNCSGTNGSSAPTFVNFTTECVAAPYVLVNNATPYTQDFETAWLSQCGTREIPAVNWRGKPVTGNNSWRRDDDGASAAWAGPTSGAYTPTSSPVSGATGTHSARFHSYNAIRGTSGQLDLSVNLAGTGAAAGLTFDYLNTSGTDSLQVLVSVNGGSTFGPALLKLTTASTWTRQTVALPATAGATTIIRLLAFSDFGTTDLGIDNVRVTYSACLPVSNLAATNVTSNGAQLSFTPPAGAPTGTTYEIEYGPQGFTLGSGTKVTGLTAASYTLASLTQSKDYCFYVRQNCGTANGNSSYAGPSCFTTPLAVPANDEPCSAVALSSTPTTGTNVGASTSTQNGIVLPITCSGSQLPKDVWFSFTPTAASLPLTITGTAAGAVRVYSSPSCSAGPFALVFCQAGPGNNQNVGPVTVTPLTPGTRYYLAVSGYGSSDTAGSFTIGGVATATKVQTDTDALLVYPNPSSTGQLTLRLSGQPGTGQAALLNALGQVVVTKVLNSSTEQSLSTRGLATGLYTLHVTVAGQVLTRKVVLE